MFFYGHMGPECQVLEYQGYISFARGENKPGPAGHLIFDGYIPLIRHFKTSHKSQKGCFPATGRAD